MSAHEVVIIGGGIGGLTTAIALRRRGIEAHVYEAAPQLRAVGAGIWVPTNAMQVLDRLGLAGAVQAAGRPIEAAELRDARSGRLQLMDLRQAQQGYGFATVAIHRARLQRILAERVPAATLHLDRTCTTVEAEGDRVRIRFQDGGQAAARVVIGADGVRSAVRRALFPAARLRYSGQTSYRGVADVRLPSELEGTGWEVWGAGCRFGFSAIAEREVYWFATLGAPPGEMEAEGDIQVRLQPLFASFPSPIPGILTATPPARITRTDMYDLAPISTWHRGRIALLGDAAHATTPNLGQGGAQAIEDAYVIAEQLAAHDQPEEAFRAYERIRVAKAHLVVKRSRQMGRIVHLSNPLTRGLRNVLLRATPASVTRKQMDALYSLDY
ncbi:MAG: FAD-dependent monooxygenase [Gemmatimonadetes bacterium]|jgi:2-polyprenyl-6-methoxyphenol hydroxylase-like FAD-dependent oxidoreductase|nr:FAD-dependent monooxygenase [Gemmatimonadota bacterium]